MPTKIPRGTLEVHYEAAAQEYLRKLKPEHFMEATPQATQREITLASFALVHAQRPEVQYFNELLVQYTVGNRQKIGQVVPDNMVVVHPEPIIAIGHFTLALQPATPFWVMEYVSNSSQRKDYVKSMEKYEKELKVPYYLTFYPDNQELSLFRHDGAKYVSVLPDEAGLHAVPELGMAVSLVDGWARFWLGGHLLPLPGELQQSLDRVTKEAAQQRRRADKAERDHEQERSGREQAERSQREAEAARLAMAEQLARLQAELKQLRDSSGKAS